MWLLSNINWYWSLDASPNILWKTLAAGLAHNLGVACLHKMNALRLLVGSAACLPEVIGEFYLLLLAGRVPSWWDSNGNLDPHPTAIYPENYENYVLSAEAQSHSNHPGPRRSRTFRTCFKEYLKTHCAPWAFCGPKTANQTVTE